MLTTSSGSSRVSRTGQIFAGSALLAGALALTLSAGEAAAKERGPRVTPAVAAKAELIPEGPLTIVVSIREQRLTVYSGVEQISRVPVSTGTRGHETPMGIFSVIQKERMHYSNLYNNAPMPFMQRLTWSGIALHAGHLPGYPASHGCVRMPADFARKLFGMTKMGARVVVVPTDTAPALLSHPRLAALGSAGTVVASADRTGWLAPPMHLGAGDAATAPEVLPSAKASPNSLLRKAQALVIERSTSLEEARARKAEAATRLDEAMVMMATAREAVAAGRAEVAKARAKVRKLEGDLQAQQLRLRELERKSDGESAAAASAEDRIDAAMQTLIAEIDAARKEAEDHEETLREIGEEAGDVDRVRARASLDNEDAALRVKIAEEALKEARRALSRRQQPVSLMVSRKSGKLYVRQGFEPLLEVPLLLEHPEAPVGTHVFTAHAAPSGKDLSWTATTLPTNAGAERTMAVAKARRNGAIQAIHAAEAAPSRPLTAAAALERFELPPDVRDQLSELMFPGSSLIISDQPLSQETGKYTDLIVLTR